jgi:hypothetical protein
MEGDEECRDDDRLFEEFADVVIYLLVHVHLTSV